MNRRVVTIKPGVWYPIDEWIAAYEAVRDPGGKYGSVGLRGNKMWRSAS